MFYHEAVTEENVALDRRSQLRDYTLCLGNSVPHFAFRAHDWIIS